MSNDKKHEPQLTHVRRPAKRITVDVQPVETLDDPITDGPLLRVGKPVKRINDNGDTREPNALDAENVIRRYLVATSAGRPLTSLTAMISDAVCLAKTRETTTSGVANLRIFDRLQTAVTCICAETPNASLDPELFGTLRAMLLLGAMGIDLTTPKQLQELPAIRAFHPDLLELLQALAC